MRVEGRSSWTEGRQGTEELAINAPCLGYASGVTIMAGFSAAHSYAVVHADHHATRIMKGGGTAKRFQYSPVL
jgi:hypothetical protein